jgi:kynurenine formamidase
MNKILLSYAIGNNTPFYIGTTEPSITPTTQIKNGDDYNTYIVKVGNHCGTHVDAPRHFVASGREISDYSIKELSFRVLVLDCKKGPNELVEVEDFSMVSFNGFDGLLIKTGFGIYRDTNLNKYLTENPGVSPEAIDFLRNEHPNIRCIGIDCISMARYNDEELAKKAHVTAFIDSDKYGKPLLFIEDMKLNDIPEGFYIDNIMVIPWQIRGVDSAPCTVIADLNSKMNLI